MRLLHLAAVRDLPFVAQPILDSQEYDRWARAILAGHAPAGAFFQAPLYPYLLAAIYAVGGVRPLSAYVTQIVAAVAGSSRDRTTPRRRPLALGRLEEARTHLARSLALNSRNSFAARNMALLERRSAGTGAAAPKPQAAPSSGPGNTPPLY